jgi:5-(carboxyamino)imidazole ribonucleotide synthase
MSPTVGVIGGGQLARMMIPAAVNLGVGLHVLAASAGEPAALAVTQLGDYRNVDDVLTFAADVDVVTFDHEHVPQEVLHALLDAGVTVRPDPAALLFAQDKLLMRARLAGLGIPQPEWAEVTSAADLEQFLGDHGGVAVLKTPRGGYDGKGVRVVRSAVEATDWLSTIEADGGGGSLLVEELVDFRRELAQLIARRPSGELSLWPIAETVQSNSVCAEVIAPAPGSAGKLADVANDIATTIAEGLDVTGVLAVELFETTDQRLLVNELAMRPHNSGHWSIDGSTTSQFEQHLRAVLDLPLGATGSREAFSVMVNILGGPGRDATGRQIALTDRYSAAFAAHPTAKFHNYGKEPRAGRKIGHVTVGADDLDEASYQARAAAAFFTD